ncbi:MAG: hypothetical protein HC915_21090 [Anaerolineae bacterium]|nr:hypothetical protein [Anaerolineae bacterium]
MRTPAPAEAQRTTRPASVTPLENTSARQRLAETHIGRGDEAVARRNYGLAVAAYTNALELLPTAELYYKRASVQRALLGSQSGDGGAWQQGRE